MPTARNFVIGSLLIELAITGALSSIAAVPVSLYGMGLNFPVTIVTSLLGSCLYQRHGDKWIDRLVDALECSALLALISLTGAVATYPLTALSRGWADTTLLSMDKAFGLDWIAYWQFVQSHPLLHNILRASYISIFVSPSILVILLVTRGQTDRVYRFLAAFLVALFITDLALLYIPAKSAAAVLLASTDPHMPQPGVVHIPIIEQLRHGTYGPVQVANLVGLSTFPSFHAACCVLFAWAGWSLRFERYLIVVVNGLMLLATPIEGGHYFVDLIGGCTVAIGAITFARMLPRGSPTVPASFAVPARV